LNDTNCPHHFVNEFIAGVVLSFLAGVREPLTRKAGEENVHLSCIPHQDFVGQLKKVG
jgi:hypothetical protein